MGIGDTEFQEYFDYEVRCHHCKRVAVIYYSKELVNELLSSEVMGVSVTLCMECYMKNDE